MRTTDDLAYAHLHRPVPKPVIKGMDEPTLFDRIETALSQHWITRNGGWLLCGLAVVMIAAWGLS